MTLERPSPAAPRPRAASAYPVRPDCLPDEVLSTGSYEVRFAATPAELEAVLRLRYAVFNLELGAESHLTGRDEDDLDARFHHLMILDRREGEVVGTYRMQTADMATELGGFYTAGEFDLSTLPAQVVAASVEIGRACVAQRHRNGRVLHLLWRGLAAYLACNHKSYLFGCCSLTSQDPALGVATLRHLEAGGHLHPTVRVLPLPATACEPARGAPLPPPHIPALFQSYLNLGAKVCGPPAIDRLFQTIDFLVLLNVDELDRRVFRSFFR
jgi:putative hemolysin